MTLSTKEVIKKEKVFWIAYGLLWLIAYGVLSYFWNSWNASGTTPIFIFLFVIPMLWILFRYTKKSSIKTKEKILKILKNLVYSLLNKFK